MDEGHGGHKNGVIKVSIVKTKLYVSAATQGMPIKGLVEVKS